MADETTVSAVSAADVASASAFEGHAALDPVGDAPASGPAVELRPRRQFIAQHRIQFGYPGIHDEPREYGIGEEFPDAGVPDAIIAALRAAGSLKLREELDEADAIARRRMQLEAENAALLARQAELEDLVKSLQAGQGQARRR